MANLLNNYQQNYAGKKDYLELLRTYARTQHLKVGGRGFPGSTRTTTRTPASRSPAISCKRQRQNKDRGRDYNHSTFNDLVITGWRAAPTDRPDGWR